MAEPQEARIYAVFRFQPGTPGQLVVRGFILGREDEPVGDSQSHAFNNLDGARNWIYRHLPNPHCIDRDDGDPITIVEVWV